MNTPVDLVCQAISTLPAESRDSFYIEQRPRQRFFCKLCQVEASMGALPYHFEDANHQTKVALLKADLERAKDLTTRFSRLFSEDSEGAKLVQRSKEINDFQAKLHVDMCLLRYLVASSEEGRDGVLWRGFLSQMRYSEQLERFMLLGLAAWKADCLLQFNGSDFYDAKAWIESGWKGCKQERISSSTIPIIVRAVGPFLGSPTLAKILRARKRGTTATVYDVSL